MISELNFQNIFPKIREKRTGIFHYFVCCNHYCRWLYLFDFLNCMDIYIRTFLDLISVNDRKFASQNKNLRTTWRCLDISIKLNGRIFGAREPMMTLNLFSKQFKLLESKQSLEDHAEWSKSFLSKSQDANSKFRKFHEFYLSAPVSYMSKQKYAHGVKNELNWHFLI